MKSIKKLGTVMLLAILFASCTTTYNSMTTNQNHHQTQVVLNEKNYRIIKYVEGDASARYFMFMGGNSSERGLIARARENMLRNAGLIGAPRAVINETVEKRVKEALFTTEVRYIVSGYVVEFYNPATEPPPAAEESTYATPDKEKRTPNVTTQGVTAGVTFPTYKNRNSSYKTNHTPGFHAGYKLEFHNPDIKYLYWATQLNFAYLNEKTFNKDQLSSREHTLGIEIPLLVGLKFPITRNFGWYINGGPTIGMFISDYTSYSAEHPNGKLNNGLTTAPSLGAELHSGFQIGKHWQLSAGHRWNIGYYEYDYSKISLSYMF